MQKCCWMSADKVPCRYSRRLINTRALLTASSSQPSTGSSKASREERVNTAQTAAPVTATATWIAPSWCLHTLLSPHPLTPPPPPTISYTPRHTHTHTHIQQINTKQQKRRNGGRSQYLGLRVKSLRDPPFPGYSNPPREHAPRLIQRHGRWAWWCLLMAQCRQ